MSDPYDLERFVTAQAPVIEQARAELSAGRKMSHWMWFIFPQIVGLGPSAMSRRYAIGSLAEAAPNEMLFNQAIDRFFDGQADPATLALIGK